MSEQDDIVGPEGGGDDDVTPEIGDGTLPVRDGGPDSTSPDEEPTGEGADDPELIGLEDPQRLRAAVEAVLFVVEAPVSVEQLSSALARPVDEITAALATLRETYDDGTRGIELRSVADGVRIYTRPELSGVVEAFLLDGQRSRLSQAALETLAVVAYRQPVTRARISAIRGVNVDGVVRTLVSRGLIIEVGTEPDSGAGLYRTTDIFLEKLGLQTLDELPSLAPLLPELDTFDADEL